MSKEQNKFKHILLVPNIVSDQAFLQRHKTFQTYVKKAHSDLYYLQLKKIGGLRKSIAEKADYGQVLQQIKSNRLQNEYLNQQKKNQGFMYNNQLWSDKYYNQIYQMTRLSQLSEVLSKQKTKGRDQLIKDFEVYFNKHVHPINDEFTEIQKVLPLSNCTTKCSSRINSQKFLLPTERRLNSKQETQEDDIIRVKSLQTSFHKSVNDKIVNLLDEASNLHIQNLETIKQASSRYLNRKTRVFQTEQSSSRKIIYSQIQRRNERMNIQTSMRNRQIHFKNKFVQERFQKEIEKLSAQNL
ncbi:unnamed protein product (macronuclear) [Paramecium tetraurelia]|uniref:Uncharacterized protein n=1 Tax=Paramecium tetraurelia TaxID=5888 RepID=A0DHR1_PARTE|nr:uncharacterized protein GSPATT00016965001 [Paramecium tetraurelia]CAK82578.1 unnamed protein product [Paramecium tetraurelia]|eukprot:XP_001449975.1 hypothetical protein (macronuclear) [Paramecium tetraurelia strain d4-2]